jgi:hypothetical protein
VTDYPINGSELARVIARDENVGREYSREDYIFVQNLVRAKLAEFDCSRGTGTYRPRYVVSEAMARRVADALDRPLP